MIRRSSRANKGKHTQRDAEIEEAFRDQIDILGTSDNELDDIAEPLAKRPRIEVDDDEYQGGDDIEDDEGLGDKDSDDDVDDGLEPRRRDGDATKKGQIKTTTADNNLAGSVRCTPCGANDSNYKDLEAEYGEDMICCDQCNTWQHNSCMNIKRVPKKYLCNICSKHDRDVPKRTLTKARPVNASKNLKNNENSKRFPELIDAQQIQVATTFYKTILIKIPKDHKDPDNLSIEQVAKNWASGLTKAIYSNFPEPTQKARAVLALLKNKDVLSRMLTNSITYLQVVSLRPEDVVKGLNEIAEKVKQASIKRSVLKAFETPRVRRTHKGEELVEDVSEDHKPEEHQVNIVSKAVDHRFFGNDESQINDTMVRNGNHKGDNENGESAKSNNKRTSTSHNITSAMLDDDDDDDDYDNHQETEVNGEVNGSSNKENALDNDVDIDKIVGSSKSPKSPPKTKSILKNGNSSTMIQESTSIKQSEPLKSTKVWNGPLTFPDFITFSSSYEFVTATGYSRPDTENDIKYHNHCIRTCNQIFNQSHYDIQGKLDRRKADPYLNAVKSSRDFYIIEVKHENNVDDYNKLFDYLLRSNKVGVLSGKPEFAKDAYLFALKHDIPEYFNDLYNLHGKNGLFAVYVLKRSPASRSSSTISISNNNNSAGTSSYISHPLPAIPPRKYSQPVNNELSSILNVLAPQESSNDGSSYDTANSTFTNAEFNEKFKNVELPENLSNSERVTLVNILEANPHLQDNTEALLQLLKDSNPN